MYEPLKVGDRVLLAGGEPGKIVRMIDENRHQHPAVHYPHYLYIVELDRRRNNGDGVDVLEESELELEVPKKVKVWVKSVCPFCGRIYEHLDTHTPKTCPKMDCLQKGMIKGLFSEVR